MSDLSAETDAIRSFAATHEGVAADIAGAADMDTVKNVAAMTPVFGMIGADYLAMFAAAQVLHAKDVNDLSAKVDHLGRAAFGTAAFFDETDGTSAAGITATGV
ncbi:type VII secretion target [Nocardia sp. NPDC004068]|uniref:type VII secretion target n=1 Tax=Nocardia sp. NPDC004068 TaxID=3364303 RepID=UPI003685C526